MTALAVGRCNYLLQHWSEASGYRRFASRREMRGEFLAVAGRGSADLLWALCARWERGRRGTSLVITGETLLINKTYINTLKRQQRDIFFLTVIQQNGHWHRQRGNNIEVKPPSLYRTGFLSIASLFSFLMIFYIFTSWRTKRNSTPPSYSLPSPSLYSPAGATYVSNWLSLHVGHIEWILGHEMKA